MASKARGLADLGNVYSDGALSNRNVIINGGMQVDQRNAGAAVTVGSSGAFIVDRMKSINGTATGTLTGQQSTLSNSKSLKLTATAAVTDLTTTKYVTGVQATLEAQDVYHMNGQTVTLSFVVETNWTGNLLVCVRNNAGNRSYVVDAAVVSGVNNVSVSLTLEVATVDAIDNGLGLIVSIGNNNEGTYQTATTGSWLAGVFLCSTASTQWTKTISNFINVTNLQLELGDTATPFEHRSYGDELQRCMRFYQEIGAIGRQSSCIGYRKNPNHIYPTGGQTYPLPVAMRSAPTFLNAGMSVTFTSLLNDNWVSTNYGNLGSYTSGHSFGTNSKTVWYDSTVPGGNPFPAGTPINIAFGEDFKLDAEL